MQLVLFLILTARVAALYMTALFERPFTSIETTISRESIRATATITITSSPPPSMTFSALITIAPLSRNPLELRQRCFDDRGFSVNCATWTGYYYTWGGSGHPYAGGPGEGSGSGSNSGSGSGNSNGAITGILGSADRVDGLKWPTLVALTTLCLLVFL